MPFRNFSKLFSTDVFFRGLSFHLDYNCKFLQFSIAQQGKIFQNYISSKSECSFSISIEIFIVQLNFMDVLLM